MNPTMQIPNPTWNPEATNGRNNGVNRQVEIPNVNPFVAQNPNTPWNNQFIANPFVANPYAAAPSVNPMFANPYNTAYGTVPMTPTFNPMMQTINPYAAPIQFINTPYGPVPCTIIPSQSMGTNYMCNPMTGYNGMTPTMIPYAATPFTNIMPSINPFASAYNTTPFATTPYATTPYGTPTIAGCPTTVCAVLPNGQTIAVTLPTPMGPTAVAPTPFATLPYATTPIATTNPLAWNNPFAMNNPYIVPNNGFFRPNVGVTGWNNAFNPFATIGQIPQIAINPAAYNQAINPAFSPAAQAWNMTTPCPTTQGITPTFATPFNTTPYGMTATPFGMATTPYGTTPIGTTPFNAPIGSIPFATPFGPFVTPFGNGINPTIGFNPTWGGAATPWCNTVTPTWNPAMGTPWNAFSPASPINTTPVAMPFATTTTPTGVTCPSC